MGRHRDEGGEGEVGHATEIGVGQRLDASLAILFVIVTVRRYTQGIGDAQPQAVLQQRLRVGRGNGAVGNRRYVRNSVVLNGGYALPPVLVHGQQAMVLGEEYSTKNT